MTDFNIRLQQRQPYKVLNLQGGLQVPARLEDLIDVSVDTNNKKDKYVLMYDVNLNKYKLVNPDDVLNAAAQTETTQPGLVGFATDFLDRVDIDLDNRIDLDAGSF
jgi:hypothetical protein